MPPERNLVRGACDQTRLVRFQGRHHDAAPRRSNRLTHGLRNRLGLACRMGVPPSPRESPAHHRRPRNPQWVQGYPTGCASITLHRNVRGFFMQLLPFGDPGRLYFFMREVVTCRVKMDTRTSFRSTSEQRMNKGRFKKRAASPRGQHAAANAPCGRPPTTTSACRRLTAAA